MDKSKLVSLGERLKTHGAQVGRMMSSKVKDLLQTPTTESKIVDEATLDTMSDSNWGLNLRICSMINAEELNGTEVVRAIKRKLSGKNRAVVHRLSLELLEACAMNCDRVFSEVASEKVVEDMLSMLDDPQVDPQIKTRIWELIRAWGESEDLVYLPVFRQTYMSLKERIPPTHDDGNSSLPLESSISNTNQSSLPYDYGIISAEEKNEFLAVTRNSLEVLSSLLDSGNNDNHTEDELVTGMKENCKNSVPTLQHIIESTDNDEGMLFEALNVLDEIQGLISRCEGQSAERNSSADLPLQPQEEEEESSKLEKVNVGARMPGTIIGESSDKNSEGVV